MIQKAHSNPACVHAHQSTQRNSMILQMQKKGLSDSTINSCTRTLKCFLSWCHEEDYIRANLLFWGTVLTKN